MSQPRKSFYFIIPLFAVLLGVLLTEATLALFFPVPFSLEKNMYFEPDPYTGYRNKPLGQGFYPTGISANANSQGMRDDEVDLQKPPGVFRVLVLGDSFTVGANVEQDEAYPQVLEALLNASSDQPVEVVNSGTGGWGPFQYARYLENYGLAFEPDLILVGLFVGNDTYIDVDSVDKTLTAVLGRRLKRDAGIDWWTYVQVFLYDNSHTARAVMSGVPNAMQFTREQCDEFNDYYLAVQKNRMPVHLREQPTEKIAFLDANVQQIAEIRDMGLANKAPTVVFVFPDENQVNSALQQAIIEPGAIDDYDFGQPQKNLNGRLSAEGIVYKDLSPAIKADGRCLYMNDTHWTPEGHRFVAEQIRDYLFSTGLMSKRP